jgi:hypothetical protein
MGLLGCLGKIAIGDPIAVRDMDGDRDRTFVRQFAPNRQQRELHGTVDAGFN